MLSIGTATARRCGNPGTQRICSPRTPSREFNLATPPDRFFLYLGYTVPHLPNEAPQSYIDRYNHIDDENRRVHAAMVNHLDDAIGQLTLALAEEGLLDNTLLWFSSDNGGLIPGTGSPLADDVLQTLTDWFGKPLPFDLLEFMRSNAQDGGSDNGPYRAGKGFVYEGGVLVPSFLSMPGSLGPTELETRVTVQDVLPTLLEVAGIQSTVPHPLDGRSAWPAIQGTGQLAPPDFAITGINGDAFYRGNWKLVLPGSGPAELYDLASDPTEMNDVAAAHPARVDELSAALAAVPRGPDAWTTPWWKFLWDLDKFGGEEDEGRPPWAEMVR